jgi:hypothetical protein
MSKHLGTRRFGPLVITVTMEDDRSYGVLIEADPSPGGPDDGRPGIPVHVTTADEAERWATVL